MRVRMKGLGDGAKLCRRSGELPVPRTRGRATRTPTPRLLAALCCGGLVWLLGAPTGQALTEASPATTGTPHLPARAVRLELKRGAALLRRQMARLPDDSEVVLVHEPDRLVLRVPVSRLFAPDTVTLRPGRDTATIVSVIAQPLKRRARLSAQVLVYTDSIGGSSFNDSVSTQRAQAVAAALTAEGIPSSRFEAHGGGAGSPLASNDSPAGRVRNRRVEIVFEYAQALKPAQAAGHAGG